MRNKSKSLAFTRREALKIGSIAFAGTAAFGKVGAMVKLSGSVFGLGGIRITPQGGSVIVTPGNCEIGGRFVTVTQSATLAVEPAQIIAVTDEPLLLSIDKPAGWAKGTRLK